MLPASDWHLRIGAQLIRFSAEAGLSIAAPATPATVYLPFLLEDVPLISADHKLIVCRGPGPDLTGATLQFDAGNSWSLLTDGQRRYVRFCPPGLGDRPLWTVVTDHHYRALHIYCSEAMVERGEKLPVIHHLIQYPLDQILLMLALASRDGLLVHAAGAVIGGLAYVFAGPSGAGKSTLTRLLTRHPRARFLSDDRLFLRRIGSQIRVFGTPWPGDAGAAVNDSAPLGGLMFLNQDSATRISPLSRQQALARLLPVASICWFDPVLTGASLSFCDTLLNDHQAHELSFSRDLEALDRTLRDFTKAA